MHVFCEHFAKRRGIGWLRAPLVEQHGHRLAHRITPVCQADYSHLTTMGSQSRRNNRHAVRRFCQREQGLLGAASVQNVRLEPREPAGGVKPPANHELGTDLQRGRRRQASDLDRLAFAKLHLRTAGSPRRTS